jgi:hypothetical protein
MAKKTTHNRCTNPSCDRLLHLKDERERGTCKSCFTEKITPETKEEINRHVKTILASAFDLAAAAIKVGKVSCSDVTVKGSTTTITNVTVDVK